LLAELQPTLELKIARKVALEAELRTWQLKSRLTRKR
jgi:hypothetical protein